MEVDVLHTLAEGSHEWASPLSIDCSFVVHIVVLPSLIELFLQEKFGLVSFHFQMSLNNLKGKLFGLVLCDEEIAIWLSILGDALSSIVPHNIGSELVDMLMAFFNLVVSWDLPFVSISPLSIVVVVTYESVHFHRESLEAWSCLSHSSDVASMVHLG